MKALKEHLNILINRYKNPVFNDEFNNALLTAETVFNKIVDNIENTEIRYFKNEFDFDTGVAIGFKENDKVLYKIEYLYPNFFDNYIYEQTICFVIRAGLQEAAIYFHPFGIVANRVNVDFYQRESFLNSHTLNHDLFMLISLLFKLK